MRCLMWYREHDLRITDNTALYQARSLATDALIGLFIISEAEWRLHDMAPIRQSFIKEHLKTLQQDLLHLNIPLIIETATPDKTTTEIILNLTKKFKINKLFLNQQDEVDEKKRDEKIARLLKEHQIDVHAYRDHMMIEPDDIKTQQGKYYSVFTPFKKAWIQHNTQTHRMTLLPKIKPLEEMTESLKPLLIKIDSQRANHISTQHWPVGEKAAQKKLNHFIQYKIQHYHRDRDFPALDGTSTLSPYLTSGVLSIRQCLIAALNANAGQFDKGNLGISTWISELIWREFYKYILCIYPRVCMHKPLQLKTDKIPWRYDEKDFDAWKNGQTGIPIVDAGMRQLNQMGWMHNRLRMIVAMFLSKNLLIDWRWGEKYFMQHLIDGDLSANNGGWQWAASTGTDAVPYFRVFNPITQAERFDPQNCFIKKYITEKNYPKPIIDLKSSRQRAIETFKSATQ